MDQAASQPRKCPGLNCENDVSTLQCPKCKDMGVDSFFCSQDCFKRSWVSVSPPRVRSFNIIGVRRLINRYRQSTKFYTRV